jgi:hypothetical protein
LDGVDGSIIWHRNVGTPVRLSDLPCGNIDPMGITGTPVIDLASRALFLNAMTLPKAQILGGRAVRQLPANALRSRRGDHCNLGRATRSAVAGSAKRKDLQTSA